MARREVADRTAATFETWLGEPGIQVAVRWVLATVFVRFCEDNGLIEYPYIAGPGDHVQLAADLQGKFYENHPESDDLGWLKAAIDALSVSPVAAGLFDKRHNPMWTMVPSPQAIKALLDFWRQTGEDGQIRYDLTDPAWNTRFLGDLYQDMSEAARKTYALLQTPELVEEFVLSSPSTRQSRSSAWRRSRPSGTRSCRLGCASSIRPADPGTFCLARSGGCCRRGRRRSLRPTGTSWWPRPCRLSTGWTRTHSRRRSRGSG